MMAPLDDVISLGGPLFRLPGTTHAVFSVAWHRHAQLASPWFLSFGIQEYIQIHLPDRPNSSPSGLESAAQKILRQADGIALVRCVPIETADGDLRPFGGGGDHPYFAEVIGRDERRFLHVESGATAVKGDPPVFAVPDLEVDEWRRLGLEMGGVEYVKISNGEAVINGLWWDEWRKIAGAKSE
ncbi:hypothetical protein BJ170DRAFT_617352 [Xylariales sp. AK1849]|nr:hypothetical protein BJ170DRAFT_617352 [Xylariales sp. AK1849]